jgi:hypothetical protein
MTLESTLQTALLLAAPRELPDIRLFRRNVGVARLRGGHTVSFAVAGQCDLYALVRGGKHIEVELKQAGAPKRIPPDQQAWADFCLDWGVPHIVLRAAPTETVGDTIVRWCAELRAVVAQ